MTVTLELKPELQERVVAEAITRGISLEAYLLSLIETAASETDDLTPEEFEAVLDAFSEGTEGLPVLPPEALTRENINEGR